MNLLIHHHSFLFSISLPPSHTPTHSNKQATTLSIPTPPVRVPVFALTFPCASVPTKRSLKVPLSPKIFYSIKKTRIDLSSASQGVTWESHLRAGERICTNPLAMESNCLQNKSYIYKFFNHKKEILIFPAVLIAVSTWIADEGAKRFCTLTPLPSLRSQFWECHKWVIGNNQVRWNMYVKCVCEMTVRIDLNISHICRYPSEETLWLCMWHRQ